MSIKVINPGLLTTIQDLGRPGYYHLGIPLSGAMDRMAHRIANMLVGNEESEACLESVFVGPTLEFNDNHAIAITGAKMQVMLDDKEINQYESVEVKRGQTLRFGHLKEGARVYIAFAGGIDVPKMLGSRSTYVIGSLGGIEGKPLAINDEFKTGQARTFKHRKLADNLRPIMNNRVTLRMLPGLYEHRITEQAKEQFYKEEWDVAPEADRMGYRFKNGTPLEFVEREQPFGAGADPSNIVDSCYPYGSMQIPSGTEPIVLHRDAVSAGGYFMLGTIISSDMDLISQMQPNFKAKFVAVTMKEALHARKTRRELLESMRKELA